MLHLKTFGGLSVDLDGIPGTGAAQQRKTLGLLALLAASGSRGLSRDKLIASLWPETDAERGRGLLKQACYALRRDLHAPELFLGSIQLRLNPLVISSDVELFSSALEENDPTRAVSFYTAPFLDGFYLNGGGEFETWAETERARLASRCRAALEVLSADATKRGEHRVAADRWRRLLELDPLSSHAALGLMKALESAGERAEALRSGEAYGRLLRSELGADPPPELSEWIERHRHVAGNGIAGNGIAGNGTAGHGTAGHGVAGNEVIPAGRFAPAGELAEPPSHPGAAPSRRSLVALRGWHVAAGLAGLVAAGVLLLRTLPASRTDPNLLAIAPFDVLDPSLDIWHEGLVDILSRDLDGAGPLRTVPQTVGIKRWHGRADRVSAASFGQLTGAGLVVFGSIGKARDTVSLRATVLDVARQRAVADLEVRGDTAVMGDLADSLGVRILQVLGRNRPIGAVRRVSIGSRSLPALKAFLYGEQFYRRGLWDSALVYYDQAIAQDSTFAIAFRRMDLALSWDPATADAYRPGEDYRRRAVALGRELSPRDSVLIAADSFAIAIKEATDPAVLVRFSYRQLSSLEEAVRRYPDDPELWLELGEARFHDHPPLGGVPGPALEAFDHAIALDPGFAPAYEHTVHLAIRLNRPDLARRYADAYLRLDPTDVNARTIRLAALMLDPKRSHAPEAARVIDSVSARVLFGAGLIQLGWWADSGETEIRLARALTMRSGSGVDPTSDTLMYDQYLALELAYRGHLQEAYAADRRLLLDASASPFSEFLDPFLSLSLLGVIPESLAATTFGHALDSRTPWPMPPFNVARQLRGLPWWLARGDTASLARFASRARQEVSRQKTVRGQFQGRYLHAAATAYLALARADSVRALGLFQAIPDTLCLENDCYYEKLTEARLLNRLGQARRAGAVLDRWVWSGGNALLVFGVLERGRIAEGLGERQKAKDSYQFVIDVWRQADPQLQSYVTEARNGLTRVTRD
ncbi:MAG TPA: BTAD domain-containing putative transcriptional regulator [Gemmatimonadales bacterium]|nr:BTAD domain-containing putative transcriptional regulator [Gemmatimonadales bacterium]